MSLWRRARCEKLKQTALFDNNKIIITIKIKIIIIII